MEFTAHTLFGCFPVIFFLLIPTASSEQFTVNSPVGPLVALVGEEVKLHCYISPAQNAEHMEVYWYRKSFTKPLQLYKRGNDHYKETSLDNIERTEILKEDIGNGNITLRIKNASVSDGGKYHCLFKDGSSTKEAVQELKVLVPESEKSKIKMPTHLVSGEGLLPGSEITIFLLCPHKVEDSKGALWDLFHKAPDLDLEIEVKISRIQGIQIKCSSGGWYPQPQMQWVNSRGELIPSSSKSETQDEAGLFHMHITLFLEQSQGMITCWLQHPVTGQEKRTSIQMAGILFQQHNYQKDIFNILIIFIYVFCISFIMFICIAFLSYKCRRLSISKGFGCIFLKMSFLLITPAIVCSTIICIYVKFGIQGSQFPRTKFYMMRILPDIFISMSIISILIAFPYLAIMKHFLNR